MVCFTLQAFACKEEGKTRSLTQISQYHGRYLNQERQNECPDVCSYDNVVATTAYVDVHRTPFFQFSRHRSKNTAVNSKLCYLKSRFKGSGQ